MKKLKIGVIFGGKSAEKEVSLATGRYVLNLVDSTLFESVSLYMNSSGAIWDIPLKLVLMNTTGDLEKRLKDEAKRIKYEDLPSLIDFMFIALLGKYGEDGSIQGVLEILKIPYSGSGVLASSVCMNKKVTKDVLRSEGIQVPRDIVLTRSDFKSNSQISDITIQIEKTLKFPVVVKPVAEGSSIGVSFVRDSSQLEKAITEAFKYDPEILIEEYLRGQEFMCVVIGNEDPVAMLPSEAIFEGDIFTYQNKYMPGKARYNTPIHAKDEKIKEIQELAVTIYKLLGLKGYGRVDGFLVGGEKIYITEPHTGTIMVPSSYVFQQAAVSKVALKTKAGIKGGSGLDPRTLITTIIHLGIDAHNKKKGTL